MIGSLQTAFAYLSQGKERVQTASAFHSLLIGTKKQDQLSMFTAELEDRTVDSGQIPNSVKSTVSNSYPRVTPLNLNLVEFERLFQPEYGTLLRKETTTYADFVHFWFKQDPTASEDEALEIFAYIDTDSDGIVSANQIANWIWKLKK